MLRSSSSRLGKVRKISLLGKGECRNSPHLQKQQQQRQQMCYIRVTFVLHSCHNCV
jgi:hypothetical protein